MNTVATHPGFAAQHRTSFVISMLVHAALLFAMSTSLILIPQAPIQMLAIEAFVVDEGAIKRVAAADQQRRENQARQEQAARDRQAEQKRIAREQQAQLVREKQAVETKRQAEALALEEQQRLAEKRKAEEVQQAAERARIEKEQLAAKQRAIEDRKRRETEARAEAERQRMLAAAEREDLERREAEMAQTMQAEESLLVASQSGEMNRYIARIQYQVESNWVKPASAQSGLSCEVAVKQLPSGDVVDVRTVRCNGDDMVRRSIEDAVHRSSPLPLPENNLLFDRNLSFTFQPE